MEQYDLSILCCFFPGNSDTCHPCKASQLMQLFPSFKPRYVKADRDKLAYRRGKQALGLQALLTISGVYRNNERSLTGSSCRFLLYDVRKGHSRSALINYQPMHGSVIVLLTCQWAPSPFLSQNAKGHTLLQRKGWLPGNA